LDTRYKASGICGTGRQHDVQETFQVLVDILKDELNPARAIEPPQNRTDDENNILSNKPVYESTMEEWERARITEQSILTDIFDGQFVSNVSCDECGYTSRKWFPFCQYTLYFPEDHKSVSRSTVEEMMDFGFYKRGTRSMRCTRGRCLDPDDEKFPSRDHSELMRISYWPEYLVLTFGRFSTFDARVNTSEKVKTRIPFPDRDLDFSRYSQTYSEPQPLSMSELPKNVKGPFIYKPYAGIYHTGLTIDGGHYVAVARSLDMQGKGEAGNWHVFNDSNVNSWRPGQFDAGDDKRDLVMLFLKRV